MNLRVNRDGKLLDRIVGAAIPLTLGLALAGVVWWRDVSNADTRTAEAILRIETRVDRVEAEAREARRAAAEDRQKITELAVDLRNVGRGVDRVEANLNKLLGMQPMHPVQPPPLVPGRR